MSGEITILVGTMTGTAEIVAEEIQIALADAGFVAEVVLMDGLDAGALAGRPVVLLCSSTYGAGDVPDNAQTLYESLEAERPDLSHLIYGVVALGDSTYTESYCQGGLRFDGLLRELGAKRAGAPLLHDASAGTVPEEIAVAWAVDWVARELAPLRQSA